MQWDVVMIKLRELSAEQRLIDRARDGAETHWRKGVPVSALSGRTLDIRLSRQSLVFRDAGAALVYIRTRMDFILADCEVGHYALMTSLDGQVISEDSEFIERLIYDEEML